MTIREARDSDKEEIVKLYKKAQAATGLPDPEFYPPSDLGKELYKRVAIQRFIVEDGGVIIAHGLVEVANPDNLSEWKEHINNPDAVLLELGGAFVDPDRSKKGVWTKLLKYRISYIRSLNAIPVTATWSSNSHVKRVFLRLGGREIGQKQVVGGTISLFVF